MTDQELMNQIQYAVIEPPDDGQSWPSGLWTREEILEYINERQNKFIKNTHVDVSSASIAVTTGTNRFSLPNDWMNTVRVYWTPASGNNKALTRSDSWEADHGMPAWPTTTGTPKVYMDGDTPTLIIQIAPASSTNETMTIYYIAKADDVDGNGSTLAITNEFSLFIKYGVLADMFTKMGRAHDPVRADYCTKRFDLGCEVTQILLKGFSK